MENRRITDRQRLRSYSATLAGGVAVVSHTNGKFELLKDHFQRLGPRQHWLPVGGDCVAQQPNQCPAIVLGQVEGAFCLQRVATGHSGPLWRDFDIGDDNIIARMIDRKSLMEARGVS
jgi:hypothetical protein